MKLKREFLNDKILAVFIGKNIGGTMGTPYEGSQEMRDIKGFVTKPGEVLANDDLDLQLVWLYAMECEGPWKMSERVLSEYWQTYITPHWNEYGIGKANALLGIAPPLSGELHNEAWKHSNGAWIRSEIWACLAPGLPYVAMKYAFMDACCDHGYGEGTYAELFTASLESMAIVNESKSIRELICDALEYIPADCRVTRAVRLVMDEYDKGTDYRTVRGLIVEQSKDLGYFQAPANIAFAVLGLVYGEGDFKKSMIYAINCGDDTDCTAATVGAFLGLYYGRAGIPGDWAEYIGDKIVTVSINGNSHFYPDTCNDLAERAIDMIIPTLKANGIWCTIGDCENEISESERASSEVKRELGITLSRGRYTLGDVDLLWGKAWVEFESEPYIKPGESLKFKITLHNKTLTSPKNVSVELLLPEGFTADYRHNLYLEQWTGPNFVMSPMGSVEVTLTAGERVEQVNRVIAVLKAHDRGSSSFIEINILG
ncbi:MAG: ADP-ribosylglycohydrolase family protein [Clostridia bacterium]|nr:ADP-ribosylglycohydrolase family protein [Clostridia bacterium]